LQHLGSDTFHDPYRTPYLTQSMNSEPQVSILLAEFEVSASFQTKGEAPTEFLLDFENLEKKVDARMRRKKLTNKQVW